MSVTERLMKLGEWTVPFVEETPYSVRSALDFFGHAVITPTHVDSRLYDDAAMLGMSRYTGVMRKRGRRSIGGVGLLVYLGDDQNKGLIYETGAGLTSDLDGWLHLVIFASGNPYDLGTITNVGTPTSLTFEANLMTPRQALDYVSTFFGSEYRVTPANVFDAGPASSLFVTSPEVVILPRGGVTELSLTALRALALEQDEDVEDYTTRVIIAAEGEGTGVFLGTADISPPTPYVDLHGDPVTFTRLVDSPETAAGMEMDYAAAQLALLTSSRVAVRLSAADYDIGRHVDAGDSVWVYDPDQFLFDLGNPQRYRGQLMYPAELRVLATTWPIEVGMGVYYRAGDGTYTDLTQWVAFEDTGASLEVGAAKRSLFRSGDNTAAVERVMR